VIQHILKRLKSLLGADEKEFRRYINMLEVLSENRDLTQAVKEAEKMLSDIDITRLPSYEIGLESGLEQGLEQGLEKGLEKGDRQRQLNIAKKMLGKLSDQEIALFTDLSLLEIKQLKQDKAP
jgi:flagellar biosynthesis/type III secretory pathway protein FliH